MREKKIEGEIEREGEREMEGERRREGGRDGGKERIREKKLKIMKKQKSKETSSNCEIIMTINSNARPHHDSDGGDVEKVDPNTRLLRVSGKIACEFVCIYMCVCVCVYVCMCVSVCMYE